MDRNSGPRSVEVDRPDGARRLVDVAFGSLGLLAIAPILVLLGLSVFLNLGRPILFAQYRAGRNRKPFLMIKFRSMLDRRDESGALLPDNERTTRFGGFLRRSRLDELPELWNVLKGDMSIVGPRPLLPETVAGMGEPRRAALQGSTGADGLGAGLRQYISVRGPQACVGSLVHRSPYTPPRYAHCRGIARACRVWRAGEPFPGGHRRELSIGLAGVWRVGLI